MRATGVMRERPDYRLVTGGVVTGGVVTGGNDVGTPVTGGVVTGGGENGAPGELVAVDAVGEPWVPAWLWPSLAVPDTEAPRSTPLVESPVAKLEMSPPLPFDEGCDVD